MIHAAPRSSFVEFSIWTAEKLAMGMFPGLIVGLVVGGLGSRAAMRVMAATSGSLVQGRETDFGATVGEITLGGTIFLLILGGVLGMIGGIGYLVVRRVLPGRGWVRGAVFGLLLLALVGRLLVDPHNVDFILLSPEALAVTMFAALPLLYGVALVPLAERLEPSIANVRQPALLIVAVVVGLIPLMLFGLLGLLVIAGCALAWSARKWVHPGTSRLLMTLGAVILYALALWQGAIFVRGVTDIL